ncbi:hypothetical protein ACOSP7_004824 [Xanthoceras sorbifolium]
MGWPSTSVYFFTFIAYKDLRQYEHEVAEREEADKQIHEELKVAKKEAHTDATFCTRKYTGSAQDELASKAELEKKLVKEAKRCKALRKEMEQDMNASKAKYKGQIHGLKDHVEKATVDHEHAYKLTEQQADDLAK